MKAVLAQLRLELVLALRNGEQLLVNLLIPLGLLVFLSTVDLFDATGDPIEHLGPAILGLAVMSSSMVSLGIGTGFERYYGVLKRLGATPLGRPRWVLAKFLSVFCLELLQWAVLIVVALLLGWSPDAAGWLPAIGGALLATCAFGGIALVLAGRLTGLTNLALSNALYLVLMVTGGMVIPLDEMPSGLQTVAKALPAAPLSDIMVGSLNPAESVAGSSWVVLAIWAVAAPLAATRLFRWH